MPRPPAPPRSYPTPLRGVRPVAGNEVTASYASLQASENGPDTSERAPLDVRGWVPSVFRARPAIKNASCFVCEDAQDESPTCPACRAAPNAAMTPSRGPRARPAGPRGQNPPEDQASSWGGEGSRKTACKNPSVKLRLG